MCWTFTFILFHLFCSGIGSETSLGVTDHGGDGTPRLRFLAVVSLSPIQMILNEVCYLSRLCRPEWL